MTTRASTVTEHHTEAEEVSQDDQQLPVRWWRRRRWQAVAVSLAVAGAAAGVVIATGGSGEDLPRTRPRTTYGYYQVKPNFEFSMGSFYIYEPGKTVQFIAAKALTSANVEYLGAYTVWPRDFNSAPGVADGFPVPEQKVRHDLTEPIPAAETARYEPGWPTSVPLTVTLGFRISSGMGAVNGIHLTYKVNGKTKRQYFPQATLLCVKPLNCNDDSLTEGSRAFRELDLVRGK